MKPGDVVEVEIDGGIGSIGNVVGTAIVATVIVLIGLTLASYSVGRCRRPRTNQLRR